MARRSLISIPEGCKNGLTKKCFELYPEWAMQMFAQRFLRAILPKWLTRLLQQYKPVIFELSVGSFDPVLTETTTTPATPTTPAITTTTTIIPVTPVTPITPATPAMPVVIITKSSPVTPTPPTRPTLPVEAVMFEPPAAKVPTFEVSVTSLYPFPSPGKPLAPAPEAVPEPEEPGELPPVPKPKEPDELPPLPELSPEGPEGPEFVWPPRPGPPRSPGGRLGGWINCCLDCENPDAYVGIGYETTEMGLSETQELTVTQADPACSGARYEWSITAGAGELSVEKGLTVEYTSPASGDGCPGNTEVSLTCSGEVVATIEITIDYNYSIEYNEELSGETVERESSVNIYVTANNTPLTWSVSGTGFSIENETTAGVGNILHADETACGSAVITITGCNDAETVGVVRCTTGQWVLIHDGPTGLELCYVIEGKYKTQYSRACSCYVRPPCVDTTGWTEGLPPCWTEEDCSDLQGNPRWYWHIKGDIWEWQC